VNETGKLDEAVAKVKEIIATEQRKLRAIG